MRALHVRSTEPLHSHVAVPFTIKHPIPIHKPAPNTPHDREVVR